MWDERYGQPGFAYGTQPNDFLLEVADRIPPGAVLSLGEGEGRNAVFLATLGHPVTALDASRVGLDKAARLARERGVALQTLHADLGEYEFSPGAWAGIVSIFCHLPEAVRQRTHRGVVSALAPGGAFLLEAYTPRQLELGTGGPKTVDLLYSLEALRRDLAGLDLVHAIELEREVYEGAYHAGRSAVVQVLAFKR